MQLGISEMARHGDGQKLSKQQYNGIDEALATEKKAFEKSTIKRIGDGR